MIPQILKNENLYDDIINKYSKKYNIDPALIKAIIARESNFNKDAYRFEAHRNDASYGLTQIMFQTAKVLGFNKDKKLLFDPDVNVNYAAQFIKSLIYRFKNIDDVIASYNMGYPRPASKTTNLIINLYGKPDPDWKYANQPYVDYVLAYYLFYKSIQLKDFQTAYNIRNLILNKKHKLVYQKYKNIIKPKFGILTISIIALILALILKKKY